METVTQAPTNTAVNASRPLTQFDKILARMDTLETALLSQKKAVDISVQELKNLKKLSQKVLIKQQKIKNKPKEGRKPHGFAVPSQVSDELCRFMGKECSTLISRTEVTKFLTKYISEHKLQNPENKKQILPDENLMALFGDIPKDLLLTHFTMQRYINRHFIRSPKPNSTEN
jgi:chromatin remodeling complex protein RSC6